MKTQILWAVGWLIALLCGPAGCSTPSQQRQIQALVRVAINHAQYQRQIELNACGGQAECRRAEDLNRWIALGRRFDAYLNEPMPLGGPEAMGAIAELVIEEMTAASADPRLILYVEDLRILLALMAEPPAEPKP